MVILVDTNIIIDALANREPYADDAKRIMEKCAAREITGILAAHSIPNLFYILRKNFSQDERRFLLKNLCEIFQVSDLNEKKIVAALENNAFSDFGIRSISSTARSFICVIMHHSFLFFYHTVSLTAFQ